MAVMTDEWGPFETSFADLGPNVCFVLDSDG